MRFHLLFLMAWLLTSAAQAQKNLLFKKIKSDQGLEIICVTDHFDSLQTNKKFSFYCKKTNEVADILNTFSVGNISKQIGENNEMHIYLVKDKIIQPIQIVINPRYKNINTNLLGSFNYYDFDINQLSKAHSKYPVNYTCKMLKFGTKKSSDDFISKHRNDNALLCYEDYTPEYEGEGAITIYKDKLITSETKGASYLDGLLKKITGNANDFNISILSSWEDGIFYYRIDGSQVLFNKLSDSRCKKNGWKINTFDILSYWLK